MDMTQEEIDEILAEMADEVVENIQAVEREAIIEFLRSDEWKYESCEDAADAIEEFAHYEEDSIH